MRKVTEEERRQNYFSSIGYIETSTIGLVETSEKTGSEHKIYELWWDLDVDIRDIEKVFNQAAEMLDEDVLKSKWILSWAIGEVLRKHAPILEIIDRFGNLPEEQA